MAKADEALDWWLTLDPSEQDQVEDWLGENPPPEDKSGISHAYANRDNGDFPDVGGESGGE